METMRIAGIVRESIVDGPGLRFTVFCQGCPHKCRNCHNQITWDFDGGYDCDIDKIVDAVRSNPLLSGITYSGGEPCCQPKAFRILSERLTAIIPELDIVLYSGYTFETLLKMKENDNELADMLRYIDILIDGPYEDDLRDLTLLFRGSSNQRVINMKKSLEYGEAVLVEKYL